MKAYASASQLSLLQHSPKKLQGTRAKTRSTSEAMDLLRTQHGQLTTWGRNTARDLCAQNGTTTSREVRAEMLKRGLLKETDAREHWLGAIFSRKDFDWTGQYKTYSDPARNVHERTIKVWALRRGI